MKLEGGERTAPLLAAEVGERGREPGRGRGRSASAQNRASAPASPSRRGRSTGLGRNGGWGDGQGREAGLGRFQGLNGGRALREQVGGSERGLYTWFGGRESCWRAIGLLLIC